MNQANEQYVLSLSTSPTNQYGPACGIIAICKLATGAGRNTNRTVPHEPTISGKPKWPYPTFLGKSHRQVETLADVQGKAVRSKNPPKSLQMKPNPQRTCFCQVSQNGTDPFPSFRLMFVHGFMASYLDICFLFLIAPLPFLPFLFLHPHCMHDGTRYFHAHARNDRWGKGEWMNEWMGEWVGWVNG